MITVNIIQIIIVGIGVNGVTKSIRESRELFEIDVEVVGQLLLCLFTDLVGDSVYGDLHLFARWLSAAVGSLTNANAEIR